MVKSIQSAMGQGNLSKFPGGPAGCHTMVLPQFSFVGPVLASTSSLFRQKGGAGLCTTEMSHRARKGHQGGELPASGSFEAQSNLQTGSGMSSVLCTVLLHVIHPCLLRAPLPFAWLLPAAVARQPHTGTGPFSAPFPPPASGSPPPELCAVVSLVIPPRIKYDCNREALRSQLPSGTACPHHLSDREPACPWKIMYFSPPGC